LIILKENTAALLNYITDNLLLFRKLKLTLYSLTGAFIMSYCTLATSSSTFFSCGEVALL
jgi:hypothetical protein